jgi:hypothetical protein
VEAQIAVAIFYLQSSIAVSAAGSHIFATIFLGMLVSKAGHDQMQHLDGLLLHAYPATTLPRRLQRV